MPILRDLFYGSVGPKNTFDQNSEYGKALTAIADNEQTLRALLTETQNELLINLCDALSALNNMTAEEHFTQGFQLGALLMMEILESRKESPGYGNTP